MLAPTLPCTCGATIIDCGATIISRPSLLSIARPYYRSRCNANRANNLLIMIIAVGGRVRLLQTLHPYPLFDYHYYSIIFLHIVGIDKIYSLLTCYQCNWGDFPKDLPPYSTVFWHYKQWRSDGVLEQIRDTLHAQARTHVKKNQRGQCC
jgi:hypothetical protein